MGDALRFIFSFNFTLDFSNFIDILGIIVNSLLALWIVQTIQNKLANKRVLKDHFISEVKDIRTEYNEYIKDIYGERLIPRETLRAFKLLNIKKDNLLSDIADIYKVAEPNLNSFHVDLRELITNSPEYSANFRNNSPVSFSGVTKIKLDRIQVNYNGVFNKLIIKINDAN